MCQSIQTTYKFCGCEGEFYQQKCPKPTATCHLLLGNPTNLKLTCYCEKHSSQNFKTVLQDQRDTARFNKEYNKILAKEEQQRGQLENRDRQSESLQLDGQAPLAIRERAQAAKEREEQIFLGLRNASICQNKRDIEEIRRNEREMEAYDQKWGERAMRRKYPIAKERAEVAKRREAQEKAIVKRAGVKKQGSCVVM